MSLSSLISAAPDIGRGPRFDACLSALKQWRDGLVREGRVPLGALKEAHLRNAVVRGRRDARVVAGMLPSSYAGLAGDIVEVILATDHVGPDGTEPDPGPDPVTAPPDATPPSRPLPPVPASPTSSSDAQTATSQLTVPAAEAGGPAASGPPGLPQDGSAFAALDLGEDQPAPGALRAHHQGGQVQLRWDEAATDDREKTFYRVVTTEDYAGYAPERADLVAVTTELGATDTRPFTAAVRYFQVWRNVGRNFDEAAARQPRLHAQAVVVAPVQGLELREDAGRVLGQWSVFSGVTRVHVFRVPQERATQARQDPQYRISAADTNLVGFIDREAVRGRRYRYQICTEVGVDGIAQLSAPVEQDVAVSARLDPVEDLQVHSHGALDDRLFDLRWTEPAAGRVEIYRTANPPAAGLGLETREETVLPAAGLRAEDRLAYPRRRGADGTTEMSEVPSPSGWDRVYFTPVTVMDGTVRVGPSDTQVVIPLPTDAVIVERTSHQVLKFGWPGQAAAVAVGVREPGATAATPQESPFYLEVNREAYQQHGGLLLPYPLPAAGCTVHLAGLSFVDRERSYGGPVAVTYPGLLRLRYEVEFKRSFRHNPDHVLVRIGTERELEHCPPFVLVHNRDRLPLHARDGNRLLGTAPGEQGDGPGEQLRPTRLTRQVTEVPFRASVRGLAGFVRLFVDVPPEVLARIALLDPAVGTLEIPG